MLKRIAALLLTVLLLVVGSIPVCAVIAVEDEYGNIRYSDDPVVEEKPEPRIKIWAQDALAKIKTYWQRHGVLTIVLLLVVAILGTVVVLTVEDEKKKKQALEKQPRPGKRKE